MIVEPSDMVRHVILEALWGWGCQVCAVASEVEALRQIQLAGTANGPLPACCQQPLQPEAATPAGSSEHCLDVEHCSPAPQQDVTGPFDVVLLDMAHVALVSALTRCSSREAQRLVFLGWPGHNDIGGQPPPVVPELELQSSLTATDLAAQPSKVLTEEMMKPHSRQLGYVTVTRPLRQGRLKLALEEVFMMQLDSTVWVDDRARGATHDIPQLKPAEQVGLTLFRRHAPRVMVLKCIVRMEFSPLSARRIQPMNL